MGTLFPLFVILAVLVAAACKNRGDDPVEYDRKTLVETAGNQIIYPRYLAFQAEAQDLEAAAMAFNSTPDAANLATLQAQLKSAWLSWQRVSAFEFGPAADLSMRGALNTWPADSTQIEGNIAAGTWDLASAANIDARGFPAIDYLLHAEDAAATVAAFQGNTARQTYLMALADDIKAQIDQVTTAWDGGYKASFTSNTATDVSSSTSLWVNQLNYDWEILKNGRIGIPLGKKTLGTPQPSKVESYYGGYSMELAVAQAQAVRDAYLGITESGANGYGLHDILLDIEAEYNGVLLADTLAAQFDAAIAALEAIPGPLQEDVVNNNVPVESAWTEIQKTVVLLKADMPSAMGILITYQDNDGD